MSVGYEQAKVCECANFVLTIQTDCLLQLLCEGKLVAVSSHWMFQMHSVLCSDIQLQNCQRYLMSSCFWRWKVGQCLGGRFLSIKGTSCIKCMSVVIMIFGCLYQSFSFVHAFVYLFFHLSDDCYLLSLSHLHKSINYINIWSVSLLL